MPVNVNSYDQRGGGNYGVVVRLPEVVADDRLVYFDHNRGRRSWVIRDFITGLRLDDNHSALSVAQIEADAVDDEFPTYEGVEEVTGFVGRERRSGRAGSSGKLALV